MSIFDEFSREADLSAPPEIVQFFRDKEGKGGRYMKQFADLLKSSVIIQGLITLCFVGTTCYLLATQQPVASELWAANGVVLGYFFGAKTQQFVSTRK